ncbi:ChaN family lipoprotein [Pontibacterium granulatum]|uniref:ChaN family lipoprotein n=1 Tax=Pontibacterium granulatum TaxID=2036029 RepID=UPI00249A2AB6|nr:ChaN family lipoprotein [Pontibacterium granulatum]MDI3326617.1 ChaN family lipoprotein [Pontibacterium granulatum]
MLKPLVRFFCITALAYAAGSFAQDDWQSPLERDHPMVGKVVDLQSQKLISPSVLLEHLARVEVVLIGEKHDNPDHHLIEKRILAALSKQSPDVVMEMLDDSQSALLTTVDREMKGSQLKQKLQWNDKGWSWASYGPLVELAVSSGLKLAAGNLSRDQVKKIYQSGSEALSADERLQSALRVNEEVKQTLLTEIYEQHCKMMPRESLNPMLSIQLARDARMASAIVDSQASRVVLVAGAYHVRKDSAVPFHLELNGAEKDVAVVMLKEVDADIDDYVAYLKGQNTVADFIWFTPKSTDRDYCADLKHGKSESSVDTTTD